MCSTIRCCGKHKELVRLDFPQEYSMNKDTQSDVMLYREEHDKISTSTGTKIATRELSKSN